MNHVISARCEFCVLVHRAPRRPGDACVVIRIEVCGEFGRSRMNRVTRVSPVSPPAPPPPPSDFASELAHYLRVVSPLPLGPCGDVSSNETENVETRKPNLNPVTLLSYRFVLSWSELTIG